MTKIRFAPALLAKFRRSSSSVAYFSSWLRSRGSASRPPRRIATLRLRCPFTDVAGRIAQRSALASTHAESGTRTAHGSDTCGSVTLTGTKSVPADAAHVRSHERYLHFGHRSTIFARTPERNAHRITSLMCSRCMRSLSNSCSSGRAHRGPRSYGAVCNVQRPARTESAFVHHQ